LPLPDAVVFAGLADEVKFFISDRQYRVSGSGLQADYFASLIVVVSERTNEARYAKQLHKSAQH
jgi:hypothetical protein